MNSLTFPLLKPAENTATEVAQIEPARSVFLPRVNSASQAPLAVRARTPVGRMRSHARAAGMNFELLGVWSLASRPLSTTSSGLPTEAKRLMGWTAKASAGGGLQRSVSTPYERKVKPSLERAASEPPSLSHAGQGLHHAVSRYDLKGVEELRRTTSNVDTVDEHGRTPLHLAATQLSPLLCKTLLLKGADPNRGDHQKMTSLHHAVSSPFTIPTIQWRRQLNDTVTMLLLNGAHPVCLNGDGKTALTLLEERIAENEKAVLGHEFELEKAVRQGNYFKGDRRFKLQRALAVLNERGSALRQAHQSIDEKRRLLGI